jgi:hypothetical protein
MRGKMNEHHIKLKRQLFDIFQHCELYCRASCCGWRAFDLSNHWLNRWCEFRDAASIQSALAEITHLEADLADRDADSIVSLDRLFNPTVESLTTELRNIKRVLMRYSRATRAESIPEGGSHESD